MKLFFKEKALTLIEILVVIAIIGILATFLLYGIAGMREEGRDARIISNMDSLRTVATFHRQETGSYQNLCSSLAGGELEDDIKKQGGTPYCYNTEYDYCTKVQLNSDYWWCVDNKGTSKTFTEKPFIGDCGIMYYEVSVGSKRSFSCENDYNICCKWDLDSDRWVDHNLINCDVNCSTLPDPPDLP